MNLANQRVGWCAARSVRVPLLSRFRRFACVAAPDRPKWPESLGSHINKLATSVCSTEAAVSCLASPYSTVELNRIFASDLTNFSGMAKTEAQVFHRQRYREAVQHIGMIGAAVVEQVACQEISLEQAGYKLGWGSKPQAIAAATERMKAALDRLVELWGVGYR